MDPGSAGAYLSRQPAVNAMKSHGNRAIRDAVRKQGIDESMTAGPVARVLPCLQNQGRCARTAGLRVGRRCFERQPDKSRSGLETIRWVGFVGFVDTFYYYSFSINLQAGEESG